MNNDNMFKFVLSKNIIHNMLQRECVALLQGIINYCIKLNVEFTKTEDINGNVVFYFPNSISSKMEGYIDGYLAAMGYLTDYNNYG